MKCSEVQALLSAYFDQELDTDSRASVEQHLDACPACAAELAGFEKLSRLATVLDIPVPPPSDWQGLEQRLEKPADRSVRRVRPWRLWTTGVVAAAMLLLFAWAGWQAQHWFSHGDHHEFAAVFGHYLETFRQDPEAAQQVLLAHYPGAKIQPGEAEARVGYLPLTAAELPVGYRVKESYVMKMPCCTCVQTLCQRDDGSTLAIFEHDDDEKADWFGENPKITAPCHGNECCLVEIEDRLAATWKQGSRYITLIGVKDLAEVETLVAALDNKQQAGP